MKRYLLLLLLLFPFIVKAKLCTSDEYYLYIENDNITVKACNEVISDYSNIVEYNNRVLTVKEGVNINTIRYNDIDLTITSNNKVAYIGTINHGDYQLDSNVHKTLTIRDYKNDNNAPKKFFVNTIYSKIEVYNSEIYKLDSLQNYESLENSEAGFVSKDSKFSGNTGRIYTSGSIKLDNVKFTGFVIQSASSYIEIKNSNIFAENYIEAPSGGYIGLYDSTISTSRIVIKSPGNSEYSVFIKNCDVRVVDIIINQASPVYIEDSNINTYGLHFGGVAYINNSTVKSDVNSEFTFAGMNIDNSTLESRGCLYDIGTVDSIINNSTIILEENFESSGNGKTTINSSYITADKAFIHGDIAINNSYFKLVTDNYKNSNYSALYAYNNVSINNSYVYFETLDESRGSITLMNRNSEVEIDDGLIVTDKKGRELYLLLKNDRYSYYYDLEGNNISSSVLISAKTKVTFKIQNGTWADGTAGDIVITKDIWDKLQANEIPSIEGLPNGHWEIVPSTDDYIKGDVTYVYVIDEVVKGVEEIEENPKTGINYIYTIISFIIAISLSIMYFKYFNKTYFMKG